MLMSGYKCLVVTAPEITEASLRGILRGAGVRPGYIGKDEGDASYYFSFDRSRRLTPQQQHTIEQKSGIDIVYVSRRT